MIPLNEVLEFIVDNRGKTVPTSDSGIPLIATNCIKNTELFPTYDKIRYVSEETYDNWFRAHPEPGDIIFVNKGKPGSVAMVPDPVDFCIAQDMMAFRVDKEVIYNKYLFAVLRSPKFQNRIMNMHVGTMIPHFKKGDLDKLMIPVPSIKVQKFIGDLYYKISYKIEVNNQINQTLENMAQELFKRWFVDFEFPNENGEPYQSSGGEMIESELGLIPKGWEVNSLETIIELHDSKRIPLSKNERTKLDKIYPYYGAASLMDYVDDYLFDGTYILLGEDGTVMTEDFKPVLQYVWGKFWVNNHAHVLNSKRDISINFLYLMLRNMNISSAVTGAVQLKINQKNLKSMKIVLPTDENLIEKFSSIINDNFESYKVLNDENQILKQIRDTLLPKLMSGEIRVPLEGLEESLTEVKGG